MKHIIFTAGLPASGKSTTAKKLYSQENYLFLDCDEIKKQHPDYNPKSPELLHSWSKEILKEKVIEAMTKGCNIVLDTTATNVNRMLSEIEMFRQNGYSVTLLHVHVELITAIKRNLKRARTVPSDMIINKFELMSNAIETLKQYVDEYIFVDNE